MGPGAAPALARVLDTVPTAFQVCVQEPAFIILDRVPMVSACLWRQTRDDRWQTGVIDFPAGQKDPDGSEWLLELLLDDSPEAYRRFAEDYYELRSVDLAAVRRSMHCVR